MGTLCKPTLSDLKVTIQETNVVLPEQQTDTKPLFLSNIDQVLSFNVQIVNFFPANPDFPPEVVAGKLKTALGKVLVPYHYLAGRLKVNRESCGRLEIDCNTAGAVYLVASSEYSLDQIGDLVYPNPAFRQLIPGKMDKVGARDQPLCIIQLTSFKCGGFALGLTTNHCTLDGFSRKIFLQNVASQCFDGDKPLAAVPHNDRTLLAARNPPQVNFPHHELIPTGGEERIAPVFDRRRRTHSPKEELDIQVFKLSPEQVEALKKTTAKGTAAKITSFNVVTAHIWRCKALSFNGDRERLSTVLFAVDIRSRLNPPLPKNYTGNAVLTAYAAAKCWELEAAPFGEAVARVEEGARRMTDEYARSAIDWGEVYKGFPRGEFLVSSWWRLGFSEVEYPWGKPRYSCPVVHHRKDIILLFPDVGGDEMKSTAVNVLVALPAQEMDKFKALFYKLIN